ncbi:MAG: D-glycero-alpha-D-manno-heptose-1,7-bisphosphate 7-phosphatase [Planctomycetota bacterium]|jgi:D-glycero-D-manno-heptose 1,7-bisphosphate phosphatase
MPNKAIFFDRDGTLIEDPGYLSHPDQVKLLTGVADALVEFRALGYKLIVVSNQSGVARGILTEKVLGQIHERLRELLARNRAQLDRIYYCPYHPEGAVGKYRKESELRKPAPGMLLAAAKDMDLDLAGSWAIGNSGRDIEAGARAGCSTILVSSPAHAQRAQSAGPVPDHKAVNMKEAVNIIKRHLRSPRKTSLATDQAQAATPEPPATKPEPPPETQEMETEPAPESPQLTEPSEVPAQTPQAPPEPSEPQPPIPPPPVTNPERPVAVRNSPPETSDKLLRDILEQLRRMDRAELFSEFSIMRLLAGVLQIIVLFCLLITVWLLMGPNRQNDSVLIALGFAVLLQLMSLTFYMIQGRK